MWRRKELGDIKKGDLIYVRHTKGGCQGVAEHVDSPFSLRVNSYSFGPITFRMDDIVYIEKWV